MTEGEPLFDKHKKFASDGYVTTQEAQALSEFANGMPPRNLKEGKASYTDNTINPTFNFLSDNENPFTNSYISNHDKIALYNIMSDMEAYAKKNNLSHLIDNYIGYDGRLLAYAEVLEKTSKENTNKYKVAKSLRDSANKIKTRATTKLHLPIDDAYEVEKTKQQIEIQGEKPEDQ